MKDSPGAGTVPPAYQGRASATQLTLGRAPTPCGICGQTVPVDGDQRTVTHPYLARALDASDRAAALIPVTKTRVAVQATLGEARNVLPILTAFASLPWA